MEKLKKSMCNPQLSVDPIQYMQPQEATIQLCKHKPIVPAGSCNEGKHEICDFLNFPESYLGAIIATAYLE